MSIDLAAAWNSNNHVPEADAKAANGGAPASRKRRTDEGPQDSHKKGRGDSPILRVQAILGEVEKLWTLQAMQGDDHFDDLSSRIEELNIDPSQKSARIEAFRNFFFGVEQEYDAKKLHAAQAKLLEEYQKADGPYRNVVGLQILKSALEHRQMDLVQALLKMGVSLSNDHKLTYDCLVSAATSTPEIAAVVLSTKPRQDFEDESTDTLHYLFFKLAFERGNSNLCNLLASQGWDVCACMPDDDEDSDEYSDPVCCLAPAAGLDAVKLALDADYVEEYAPLVFATAVRLGKYDVADWIRKRFPKSDFGASPEVHEVYARALSNKEMEKLKFLWGCRIFSPEILMEAVIWGHKPLAEAIMKEDAVSATDALWCYVDKHVRFPLSEGVAINIQRFVALGAQVNQLNEAGQSMVACIVQNSLRMGIKRKWRVNMLQSIGWFCRELKADPSLKNKDALSLIDVIVRLANKKRVVREVLQPVIENMNWGDRRQAILNSAFAQAWLYGRKDAADYLAGLGAHPQQALETYARIRMCEEEEVKALVAKGANLSDALLPALFARQADNFFLLREHTSNRQCVDKNGLGLLTYLHLQLLISNKLPLDFIQRLFSGIPQDGTSLKDRVGALMLANGKKPKTFPDFSKITLPPFSYQQLVECLNHLHALVIRFLDIHYDDIESENESPVLEIKDNILDGIKNAFLALCDRFEGQFFEFPDGKVESDSKEANAASAEDIAGKRDFLEMIEAKKYPSVSALVDALLKQFNATGDAKNLFTKLYVDRLMGDWRKEHYAGLVTVVVKPVLYEFSRLQRPYDHIMAGRGEDREKALAGTIVEPIWDCLVSSLDEAGIELPSLDEFKGDITKLFMTSNRLNLTEVGKHCAKMIEGVILNVRKTHFIERRMLNGELIRRCWIRELLLDFGVIIPRRKFLAAAVLSKPKPEDNMDTTV